MGNRFTRPAQSCSVLGLVLVALALSASLLCPVFQEFVAKHCAQLLNTFGLLLDIGGACLLAYELFNQFQGQDRGVKDRGRGHGIAVGVKRPEYVEWEKKRNRAMTRGLLLLTAGFLIQALAGWLPTFLPKVAAP